MYPGLSHGAYEALHAHGTDEQKQLYLPKLTSGEWTGTMCLTEPHCGTDLGMLRTKAEPQADGTLQAHRQQDLHLAPASTTWPRTSSTSCWRACPMRRRASKGISLFVVPKFHAERRRHGAVGDVELGHDEQRDALAALRRVGQAGQHQVDDVVRHVVLAGGDEDLVAGDAGTCRRPAARPWCAAGRGRCRNAARSGTSCRSTRRSSAWAGRALLLVGAVRVQRLVGAVRQARVHGPGLVGAS